jgi:hypothetical protein
MGEVYNGHVHRRVLLLLIGLTMTGGLCGGGPPPTTESCSAASRDAIDTLEIGVGDPFQPLEDGAAVETTHGPQGGAMLVLRLRVTGSAAPACLQQKTDVTLLDGGTHLAGIEVAVPTYSSDGHIATAGPLYLIYGAITPAPHTQIRVVTEAGGLTVTRSLVVN